MPLTGRCHCSSIRYEIDGPPLARMLCHCSDCRRHAGAPVVGWAMFPAAALRLIRGEPRVYHSSEHGRRHFCGDCGTGLLYVNAHVLPDLVDVQIASLDDPSAVPPDCHVQTDEQIEWMRHAHRLPTFARYPPSAH